MQLRIAKTDHGTAMNVFVTGATGFIGRALLLRLRRDGHTVSALTRSPEKARSRVGTEANIVDATAGDQVVVQALEEADAVVNLAGEPLIGERWDEDKKRRIRSSRVDFTRWLVSCMERAANQPGVLISGSAVGYYGNRGDSWLEESAAPGDGFLAEVCADWEKEALAAEALGTRVVNLRTGVVLGRQDGALDQMLTPFRLGLGGPVGPGTQYVPWVHIDDLIELIVAALQSQAYSGPLNGCAPGPVTFRTLAKELGDELDRPAVLPVPTFALKLLFGEAASVLTDSQRVKPAKAMEAGFQFRFPDLEDALEDILDNDFVQIRPVEDPIPESKYLTRHRPTHILQTSVRIKAPVEEVFAFFSRAENLGLITPPAMGFRITEEPEQMGSDARISYRLKVGPLPISWTSHIEVWEDGKRFVDSQLEGPYAAWWHEHAFSADRDETVMQDRVYYAAPMGPLGRLANQIYVGDQLKRVFGYRAAVIRRRFGAEMR